MEISIFSAIMACAWVLVLANPNGGLFGFVPKYVTKWTSLDWIHSLSYRCEKCIAGQIGLWWSLFTGASPIEILVNTSGAIIFAGLIEKVWQKLSE